MKVHIVATVTALALITSCGSSLTDRQLDSAIGTWSNQLGLLQESPAVWERRIDEACTKGVWRKNVVVELATRYVDEDAGLSIGSADTDPVSIERAADALWIITIQVCRELFPPDAIDQGPPFLGEE